FTVAAWVYLPEGEDNFTVVSQTDPKSRGRGWALELNARIPMLRVTSRPNESMTVRGSSAERLEPGTWNHITFTYDGSGQADGLAVFLNGESVFPEGRGYKTPIKGDFRNYAPLRIGSDGRRK